MKKIEKGINKRFIQAADDIIHGRKKGVVDKGTFCKALKVHNAVYAQINSNLINLPIDKAVAMGKTFDVSMNWLLLGKGSMYINKEYWKQDILNTIKKLESLL